MLNIYLLYLWFIILFIYSVLYSFIDKRIGKWGIKVKAFNQSGGHETSPAPARALCHAFLWISCGGWISMIFRSLLGILSRIPWEQDSGPLCYTLGSVAHNLPAVTTLSLALKLCHGQSGKRKQLQELCSTQCSSAKEPLTAGTLGFVMNG